MNNSVVFNKIHMRNRIFNLHLFLSCLFMKSHVQKTTLSCLFIRAKQRYVWAQRAPASGETQASRPVRTELIRRSKLRCYTSMVCKGNWAPISQAEKFCWNAGLEGTYAMGGKWHYHLLWRAAPRSQPRFASVTSSGFGSSQPGRSLRLRTPGAWHLQRWELHLTETSLASFLMCPVDKPSIPGPKMSPWSQNSFPILKSTKGFN